MNDPNNHNSRLKKMQRLEEQRLIRTEDYEIDPHAEPTILRYTKPLEDDSISLAQPFSTGTDTTESVEPAPHLENAYPTVYPTVKHEPIIVDVSTSQHIRAHDPNCPVVGGATCPIYSVVIPQISFPATSCKLITASFELPHPIHPHLYPPSTFHVMINRQIHSLGLFLVPTDIAHLANHTTSCTFDCFDTSLTFHHQFLTSPHLTSDHGFLSFITTTHPSNGCFGVIADLTVTITLPRRLTGLLNQGATCYVNSLLQILSRCDRISDRIVEFASKDQSLGQSDAFVPPTTPTKQNVDIITALASTFLCLRPCLPPPSASTPPLAAPSDPAASTHLLTRAFGWDNNAVFQHHDMHELLLLLMDQIDECFKNTPPFFPAYLPSLAQITTKQTITCCDVEFTSSRLDSSHCLQLPIFATLNDSLDEYFKAEDLSGDCQYDTDTGYGKQDAKKHLELAELPKYLFLQFCRIRWDMTKINDEMEVPASLDLEPYMSPGEPQHAHVQSSPPPSPPKYELTCVLVHSGTCDFGHYYVFIKTAAGQWFKMNDDIATPCSWVQVSDEAKGGTKSGSRSAYLCVYEAIPPADVPPPPRLDVDSLIPLVKERVTTLFPASSHPIIDLTSSLDSYPTPSLDPTQTLRIVTPANLYSFAETCVPTELMTTNPLPSAPEKELAVLFDQFTDYTEITIADVHTQTGFDLLSLIYTNLPPDETSPGIYHLFGMRAVDNNPGADSAGIAPLRVHKMVTHEQMQNCVKDILEAFPSSFNYFYVTMLEQGTTIDKYTSPATPFDALHPPPSPDTLSSTYFTDEMVLFFVHRFGVQSTESNIAFLGHLVYPADLLDDHDSLPFSHELIQNLRGFGTLERPWLYEWRHMHPKKSKFDLFKLDDSALAANAIIVIQDGAELANETGRPDITQPNAAKGEWTGLAKKQNIKLWMPFLKHGRNILVKPMTWQDGTYTSCEGGRAELALNLKEKPLMSLLTIDIALKLGGEVAESPGRLLLVSSKVDKFTEGQRIVPNYEDTGNPAAEAQTRKSITFGDQENQTFNQRYEKLADHERFIQQSFCDTTIVFFYRVLPLQALSESALKYDAPLVVNVLCASNYARHVMHRQNPAQLKHQLPSFFLPLADVVCVVCGFEGSGRDLEQQFADAVGGGANSASSLPTIRILHVDKHRIVETLTNSSNLKSYGTQSFASPEPVGKVRLLRNGDAQYDRDMEVGMLRQPFVAEFISEEEKALGHGQLGEFPSNVPVQIVWVSKSSYNPNGCFPELQGVPLLTFVSTGDSLCDLRQRVHTQLWGPGLKVDESIPMNGDVAVVPFNGSLIYLRADGTAKEKNGGGVELEEMGTPQTPLWMTLKRNFPHFFKRSAGMNTHSQFCRRLGGGVGGGLRGDAMPMQSDEHQRLPTIGFVVGNEELVEMRKCRAGAALAGEAVRFDQGTGKLSVEEKRSASQSNGLVLGGGRKRSLSFDR